MTTTKTQSCSSVFTGSSERYPLDESAAAPSKILATVDTSLFFSSISRTRLILFCYCCYCFTRSTILLLISLNWGKASEKQVDAHISICDWMSFLFSVSLVSLYAIEYLWWHDCWHPEIWFWNVCISCLSLSPKTSAGAWHSWMHLPIDSKSSLLFSKHLTQHS